MSSLLAASLGFCLAQLLLSGSVLAQMRPFALRQRLFILLLLAIAAYISAPLALGVNASWLGALLATAVPGVFWLFSASVFDDRFQLRGWQVLLVLLTMIPPALARWAPAQFDMLLRGLPQALEFVIMGLTFWVVVGNWRGDLVQARRTFRIWFVGFNGFYIFVLILSREVLFHDRPWLAEGQYMALALVLLIMNLLLLRHGASGLFLSPAPLPETEEAPPRPAPPEDAQPLLTLMTAELVYREMGLTIGDLAQRLDMPQYRLRKLINEGLGYRNFSDFLNRYRIEEAAQRLANPEEHALPVLTIAMDAGFRSLSSFNKAFKQQQGVTPTAWRNRSKSDQ